MSTVWHHDLGMASANGIPVKGTIDMGESVSFMARCFAIKQLFGATSTEQIYFLHLY